MMQRLVGEIDHNRAHGVTDEIPLLAFLRAPNYTSLGASAPDVRTSIRDQVTLLARRPSPHPGLQ